MRIVSSDVCKLTYNLFCLLGGGIVVLSETIVSALLLELFVAKRRLFGTIDTHLDLSTTWLRNLGAKGDFERTAWSTKLDHLPTG